MAMQINTLQLYTPEVSLLPAFYQNLFPQCKSSFDSSVLQLQAGSTTLNFWLCEQPTQYHFAFNIPYSQVDAIAELLTGRVEVLPGPDGKAIVEFPNWKARSLYFKDPAGNIVELIGRQRLGLAEGDLKEGIPIYSVSEMGLASREHHQIESSLRERCGCEVFWTSGEVFSALGDEEGLIILVDSREKTWYPTDYPAYPYGFRATISNRGKDYQLRYDGRQLFLRNLLK